MSALTERVAQSKDLGTWIGQSFPKLNACSDGRIEWLAAYALVAYQHHTSIIVLYECKLIASATALIRPLFEAVVGGIWFSNLDEAQRRDFLVGKLSCPKDALKAVKHLKATAPDAYKWFHAFSENHLKPALHDLTHGGIGQLRQNYVDGHVAPHIDEQKLPEVLDYLDGFAIWAMGTFAEAVGNVQVFDELIAKQAQLKEAADQRAKSRR